MSKREEIQEFVGRFVVGLTKLMRESAHETVDATFGEGGGSQVEATTPTKRLKSPRRASAPKQLAAAPAAANGDAKKQVLAFVRANQGCGGGAIKAATGVPQWKLGQVLTELAGAGAIKKAGNGRGTTYSTR